MHKKIIKSEFSNSLMKNLLKLNQPGNYSEKLAHQIDQQIAASSAEPSRLQIRILSGPVIVSIALLLIFFSIVFIYSKYQFQLNNNLMVYKSQTAIPERITRSYRFTVGSHEIWQIESRQAVFILHENSKLTVQPTVKNIDRYFLIEGTLTVQVDHLNNDEELRIDTRDGQVRVTGTRFKITKHKNLFKVNCQEGQVEIINTFLNEKRLMLRAGYELTIQNRKSLYLKDVSSKEQPIYSRMNSEQPDNTKISQSIKEKTNTSYPPIFWQKQLPAEKYGKIILFTGYLGLITPNHVLLLNQATGEIINQYELKNEADGFGAYNDVMFYYDSAQRVNILHIPDFKLLKSIVTGPIAFGRPAIEHQNLIVASTDHYLYLYELPGGILMQKVNFDAGFYCTPVIIQNKVILSNIAKKIILYSLEKKTSLWQYQAENRLSAAEPVIDLKHQYLVVTDENNNGLFLSLKTGQLLFKFRIAKDISPVFADQYLMVYQQNTIKCYDFNGNKIIERTVDKDITGILYRNNTVLLINTDHICLYNTALIKQKQINTGNISNFTADPDKIYIINDRNMMIAYNLADLL